MPHTCAGRRVALRCNDCMPPVISSAIKAHAQMAQSDEQGLARSPPRSARKEGRTQFFIIYHAHTNTHPALPGPRIQRRGAALEALPSSPTHTPAVREQTLSFPIPFARQDTQVAKVCLRICRWRSSIRKTQTDDVCRTSPNSETI